MPAKLVDNGEATKATKAGATDWIPDEEPAEEGPAE